MVGSPQPSGPFSQLESPQVQTGQLKASDFLHFLNRETLEDVPRGHFCGEPTMDFDTPTGFRPSGGRSLVACVRENLYLT